MNTNAKRSIRIVTILLLLPVVLVVCALLFLSSPLGEEFIRREAMTRLEAMTDLDIEIGDVSTSLFTQLTLRDVHVRHRTIAPDQDVLAFERLKIEYDLLPLMSGMIRIDSLSVDSLVTHLVMNEHGELNFPAFSSDAAVESADTTSQSTSEQATEDAESSSYRFSLGGARIHIAQATYGDAALPLHTQLDSAVVHVNGQLGGLFHYQLDWDQVQVDTDGRSLLLQDIFLRGRYSGDFLSVDRLSVNTPGAELTGSAKAEIDTDQDSLQAIQAGLRLNVDLSSLSPQLLDLVPTQVKPLAGRLALDVTVEGSEDDPHFVAQVRSDQLQAGELTVYDVLLGASATLSGIKLDQLRADVFDGHIRVSGSLAIDELLTHHLKVDLDGIDVRRVHEVIASIAKVDAVDQADSAFPSQLDGRLSGFVLSRGPLNEPWSQTIDAELAADLITHDDQSIEPISLNMHFHHHTGDLQFFHGSSSLRATAEIDSSYVFGQFNVAVDDLTELTRLAGVEDVTGSLRLRGSIFGSSQNPNVSAAISSDGLVYQNFPVDSLQVILMYEDSSVTIDRGYLAGMISVIDTATAPFGLTDLRGGFSYEASVSGELPDVTGSLELAGTDLGYGELVADDFDTRISFRNNQVELTKLEVTKTDRSLLMQGNYSIPDSSGELSLWVLAPESQISPRRREFGEAPSRGSGRTAGDHFNLRFALSDGQRISVRGEGRELNLANVPHVHPSISGLGGKLDIELVVDGSLDDPHGTITLSADSLRTDEFVIDSFRLTSSFDSTQLQSDLAASIQSSEPMTASIRLPLERSATGFAIAMDQPISGEVVGDDIQLDFLNSMLPDDVHVDGILTVAYNLAGSLSAPSVLGELNLDDGRIEFGDDQPPLDSINVNVTQWDSSVHIERIDMTTIGHDFHLAGRLSILDSLAIQVLADVQVDTFHALRVDAHHDRHGYTATLALPELPVAPLKEIVPEIEGIKGILTGTVTVEGDTGIPNIHGTLQGSGIRVAIKDVRERLHDGEFTVQIENDSIVIDTLFAKFGDDGRLIASGLVGLNEQHPIFNLQLRGGNIGLEQDDYSVRLNGMTLDFVTNEQNRHVLSGDVRIGETRYVRDYRLDTILRMMNDPPTRSLRKPNEIADNIDLDLRLREADQLWIDNNLAEVRMDANISVIGTIGNPMITGRVLLDEGYVMYLDRKFEIEEGVADFVDTQDINPYLNVVGTSTVIDYEKGEQFQYDITMMITGNAKSARIEMTSDPYLEQSSILSLLTFGTPDASQGGMGSQAGAFAGRALSNYVGGALGSAIGLESVSVQGNLFAPEESGATLLATKEISNRAEITYITNVSGFNENTIRVTYFLDRRWMITGETNQEGEGSIDLKMKVRWNEIRWE